MNMNDPADRMAVDYIIEKCYEMWVLTVSMNINVSDTIMSEDYTKYDSGGSTTQLAAAATQPTHILVGSVFVVPEFYMLLKRGKRFYPKAFSDYVEHCITLYRSRKNPNTGRLGFVVGDKI